MPPYEPEVRTPPPAVLRALGRDDRADTEERRAGRMDMIVCF
jgi:hypothetical protein